MIQAQNIDDELQHQRLHDANQVDRFRRGVSWTIMPDNAASHSSKQRVQVKRVTAIVDGRWDTNRKTPCSSSPGKHLSTTTKRRPSDTMVGQGRWRRATMDCLVSPRRQLSINQDDSGDFFAKANTQDCETLEDQRAFDFPDKCSKQLYARR
jgi:hypothetical protein